MTSGARATVDHGHLDVRLSHQRIGKREPCRSCPYDQIVGFDNHVSPEVLRAISATLSATIEPTLPQMKNA